MRHLTAAQRQDGAGWHYVSMKHHGGYPLGPCAEHAPHPTEADARECFAQFQRDHVRLDGKCSWTSCSACKGPADTYARIEGDGYHSAPLCAEHLTIEHAIDALHLTGPAGDACVS